MDYSIYLRILFLLEINLKYPFTYSISTKNLLYILIYPYIVDGEKSVNKQASANDVIPSVLTRSAILPNLASVNDFTIDRESRESGALYKGFDIWCYFSKIFAII